MKDRLGPTIKHAEEARTAAKRKGAVHALQA